MQRESHAARGYVLAALAGAAGGALAVALSTRMVRDMMTEMKSMRDECCKMMGRTEQTEGASSASCEECGPETRSASG